MSNQHKLAEIENTINAQPPELVRLVTLKLGIESAREKIEGEAMTGLLWQCEPHNCHPQLDGEVAANTLTTWLIRGSGQEVHALAAFDAAERALEKHPRYAEAVAALEPLLLERDKLREAVAAEQRSLRDAREKAAEAVRQAQERAAAAAANDPEVAAARAALLALENPPPAPPAPPFRGRVKVASV